MSEQKHTPRLTPEALDELRWHAFAAADTGDEIAAPLSALLDWYEAAPDLVEALANLKEASLLEGALGPGHTAITEADAAIAKATGGAGDE